MKFQTGMIFLLGLMLRVPAVSYAEVGVQVSIGDSGYPRHWDRPRRGPYDVPPYFRRSRESHFHHPVYAYPLVVTQPAYYPSPVMVEPPVPSVVVPLTGDYGTDHANFNQKLSRLRAVLQRQNQAGQLTSDQYNGFMDTLDGIEHDAHAWAYDRGGNLTPDDFAELYRRLNQADEDIEIALAS